VSSIHASGKDHRAATMAIASRYVIVSPVKDEAPHIALTLRSVVEQQVQPLRWVIVDDGSADGTAEIVERWALEHPFITLLRSGPGSVRNTGRAEVLAFNRGFDTLVGADFDFVVKLDGDLSFGSDYFEKLLERFDRDPALGIASGVYLEEGGDGEWRVVGMPSYHAFGASKVVRRRCFEEIGGFAVTPGWDTADEIRAWGRGWTTGHFRDLEVKHHKPEGSAMGFLRTSRMHGEIHYVTGGDPLFLLFKIMHRARLQPVILGALAVLFGYVSAVARQRPVLVSKREARNYRRLLRRRLWSAVRNPFDSTEFRI
jgi:poly-beta-1,6-N-acetyl-D-glucosamine synthase